MSDRTVGGFSLLPLSSSVPIDEDESFAILIQAKARHPDLWPLAQELGSQKVLADRLGVKPTRLCSWINLRRVPNRSALNDVRALDVLHTLTGKSFDELWPLGLRRVIEAGHAACERTILVEMTGLRQLAERTSERLILPSPLEQVASEESGLLARALATLTSRERRVLELRIVEGKTLEQSASQVGISRERIRQIECRAISKLRERAKRTPVLREYAPGGLLEQPKAESS